MVLLPTRKNMETRKRGAFGKPLLLALKSRGSLIDFTTLASPALKIRKVGEPRSSAVTGAGTLSNYMDTSEPPQYSAQYTWDSLDPDEPGIYVIEVDALLGGDPVTFSDEETLFLMILEDVG